MIVSNKTLSAYFTKWQNYFNVRKTWVVGGFVVASIYLLSFINPQDSKYNQYFDSDTTFGRLQPQQQRLPEFARYGLRVNDSLAVHLFAWEPHVKNPTNIDIDAKGRVWVCEGYNYRPTLNPKATLNPKGDRIVILADTDGDNIADVQKVFFQGPEINAALGISVLGNKVLVSCSPEVFYLIDDDGDDIADRKEILFKGIGGIQHDHGMHVLVFGPDGKLYGNFGNEGKQLLDKFGKPVVDIHGRVVRAGTKDFKQGIIFRCNLDGSEVEVLAHNFRNSYEVAIDAYGTLWQSDNDDDGNQAVRINQILEYGNYGYTDEMTGAGWQTERINQEAEVWQRQWHLNDPGVVPNVLITGAGSPTGMLVYEGTHLPRSFHNQVIHTDAGPKVLRAYLYKPNASGYDATIRTMVEGIDDWFRPSDVCVAPDGSLILADWYDPVVGGHQRGDVLKGRLYKVQSKYPAVKDKVVDFSNPESVAVGLASPNMATRYMCWQWLKAQKDKGEKWVVKLLKSESPAVRARALWYLNKIQGKEAFYIQKALDDANPNIQIAGIRMARQFYKDPVPLIEKLASSNHMLVKRELAIALRVAPLTEKSTRLWCTLAKQYKGNDRWYLEALGIGATPHWDAYFEAFSAHISHQWHLEGPKDILWRSRSGKALPFIQKILTDPNTPKPELLKFFRTLDFIENSTQKSDLYLALLDSKGPNYSDIQKICIYGLTPEDINRSGKLKKLVFDRLQEIEGTEEYINLVERFKLKEFADKLYKIIVTTDEMPLAEAAAKTYYALTGLENLKKIMETKPEKEQIMLWESMIYVENQDIFAYKMALLSDPKVSNLVKKSIINSFRWGWDGQDYFLNYIKSGGLPSNLHTYAANLFMNANRPQIREEAAKYIAIKDTKSKEKAIDINELVSKSGNLENGILMYKKHCMSCHVVHDKGINFGPALSEIGSKFGKEGLYLAIAMPDAGVSFGYEGYMIKTQDGGGAVGIVVSDTESDLDIKIIGGKLVRFKKSEIIDKKILENSLMPNLASSMTENELVDLVEYLSSLKKPN